MIDCREPAAYAARGRFFSSLEVPVRPRPCPARRHRSPLLVALLAGAAPVLGAGGAWAQGRRGHPLDTITVAGAPQFRETATGPVQGYRAPAAPPRRRPTRPCATFPDRQRRAARGDRRPGRNPARRCPVQRQQRAAGRYHPGPQRHLHHPRLPDPDLRHRRRVHEPGQHVLPGPARPRRCRARIEVLKGPASVLYGRGDPGGVINIVTRQPTLVPTADASIQGGSFGFRRVQGSASGAVPGSRARRPPQLRDAGRPDVSRPRRARQFPVLHRAGLQLEPEPDTGSRSSASSPGRTRSTTRGWSPGTAACPSTTSRATTASRSRATMPMRISAR